VVRTVAKRGPVSGAWSNPAGFCRLGNGGIALALALYFLILPGATVIHDLADPNLRTADIPHSAWKFHQDLSPQYGCWARARLDSGRAAKLSTADIAGTEWPLFGSVFYLLATESLQAAWEQDHSRSAVAPNVYARNAIEAATELVIDPTQANWVKIHWGENYLKVENVFYRMLVISSLTSHARLTGEKRYLPRLRDQVESLSAELDASPHGWLDDYPGQCFPADVLTAIAMIRRADAVLGTDHSAFVQRARRGFQGATLDGRGLVPYAADAPAGKPTTIARGCGNSYVALFAPDIWPEPAREWYDLYGQYFWQEKWTCAGFREFPNDLAGNDWYGDVDSGPVLGGFGCAACAFGVGAARANGHFEQAYPLTGEMLVTSWPLPNGTRLLPRLLSNAADAPLLGEASILYNLTRLPAAGVAVKSGGTLPKFVWIFLSLQLGAGVYFLVRALQGLVRWPKQAAAIQFHNPGWQAVVWLGLVLGGVVCFSLGNIAVPLLLLVIAQIFPLGRKINPATIPAHES